MKRFKYKTFINRIDSVPSAETLMEVYAKEM